MAFYKTRRRHLVHDNPKYFRSFNTSVTFDL